MYDKVKKIITIYIYVIFVLFFSSKCSKYTVIYECQQNNILHWTITTTYEQKNEKQCVFTLKYEKKILTNERQGRNKKNHKE